MEKVLSQARKYIGQAEIPGPRDNAWIVGCFKFTVYDGKHDEVPWCAAFICRILAELGIKSTRSAAASSYLKWGVKSELVPGAIVVLDRGGGKYHVTVFSHWIDKNTIACVGGNQNNRVQVSRYLLSKVKAVRKAA